MSTSVLQQPYRVLYLDHTAMLGGGEIALLHMVTHLDMSRFYPVVALSSTGDLVDRLNGAGIETHVLPLHPAIVNTRKDTLNASSISRVKDIARTIGYSLRLAKFIRQHRFDIIHTNSLKSDIIGGIAARLTGVKLVWHIRDRIAEDYLPAKVCKIFRWLCRKVPHVIIANSQATLDTLMLPAVNRSAMARGGKIESQVVHDGIVTSLATRNGSRNLARLSACPRIGLIGRITPWKGQDVFIKAAAKVHKQFPGARFLIVGSAMFGELEYEAKIRALVEDNNLGDCVEFLGFRNDIPEFVHTLDILVHASTVAEPFGQVVIEGMAAGKPVVASRGGGVLEIVEDGASAILVDMGADEEMAHAICSLISDPVRAAALGQTARQTVLERFTIERTATQVQNIYESLLRPRTGRWRLHSKEAPQSLPGERQETI